MTRKILSILLILCLLVTAMPLSASAASTSGNCGPEGAESRVKWEYEESTRTLTISGTGPMGDWSGFGFTFAPWDSKDIDSVVIQNGVTSIGSEAFRFADLTSVSIPNSVTSIGEAAFAKCLKLTNINIPDGVKSIGEAAFSGCELLSDVTIGNGVASIGEGAFYLCDSLTAFQVKSGNARYTVQDGVLFNKAKTEVALFPPGRSGAYVVPNTATSIGDTAFADCEKLTGVVIPNSVTNIGEYAFAGCGLTDVTIPDSVTHIEAGAFQACESLSSVTIGNSVTSIGENAFYGCEELTGISIPDSVTHIGAGAFEGCNSSSVIIGKGVTSIGEHAFQSTAQCDIMFSSNLTAFQVASGNAFYASQDGVLFNKTKTELVLFPAGRSGAYVVPNTVTSIANDAFACCAKLTDVVIPGSVTRIGERAFDFCEELSTVTMENGVTHIGAKAFRNCGKLASITMPDSVVNIGGSAFRNCWDLTSVTIPQGVTSIDWGTFYECFDLTDVRIPNGVTKIAYGAFAHCGSLKSVSLPQSLISMGGHRPEDSGEWVDEGVFYDCTSLERAVFQGNTPTMEKDAFYGTPDSFSIYYQPGARGWTTPTWTSSAGDTYPCQPLAAEPGALAVDWSKVAVQKSVPYGTTNSGAVTALPGSGTATAGGARLDGTFAVENASAVQGAGARKVAVVFTVTTDGEYKGETLRKEYNVTITKANITGITTAAPTAAILASDVKNTAAALKTAISLPNNVTVTYQGGTESLPITWGNAAEAFTAKGRTYTFKGTVSAGENFNAYKTPLTATLTVKPVNGTLAAIASPVVVAKNAAEKAASYADFKLPTSITINCDNGVAAQTITPQWSVPLNTLKAKAAGTKTAVRVTNVPEWLTIPDSALTAEIQITDRFPVKVSVTQSGTTYGTALPDPSAAQTAISDGIDSGAAFSYHYTGITVDGRKYDSANKPTDAGSYTVTAVLVSDTHAGSASAEFAIAPKMLTLDMVAAIPSERYNKAAHKPEPVVTDGSTLKKGIDYTVDYQNNINVGTAAVVIVGKGNYTGTVNQSFMIEKDSIADMVPAISGTAQVGSVLTASLTGIDAQELTWQWSRGGVAISGATGRTYVPVTEDANKDITVKAISKEQNYTGTTASSEAVTVAKQEIGGVISIAETNGAGTAGTIDQGDALTVVTDNVFPIEARSAISCAWLRNGEVISGAAGLTYIVTDADAGSRITAQVSGIGDFAGQLTAAVEVGKAALTGIVRVSGAAAVDGQLTAAVSGTPENAIEGQDYEIVWLRDGKEISGAAGGSYTVKAEDQGKTISAAIKAKGTLYTGEIFSAAGMTIPAAVPGVVTLNLTAGNGKITASWKAPSDNGAPVQEYILTISSAEGGSQTANVNNDKTSYVFENLENGQTYTVTILAQNAVGSSVISSQTAAPKAGGGGTGGGGGGSIGGGSVSPAIPTEPEISKEPVVETRTDPNGTVTVTTTWPDGKKTVQENAPDGAVKVEVTVSTGETMAKLEIPADPGQGRRFVDVSEDSWYEGAVNKATAYNLFNGTSENTFTPDGSMTRGMVAQVLYNLSGKTGYGAGSNTFIDVPAGEWYESAVGWAAKSEVVSGMGANRFAPNQVITREQLVTMLYNYANAIGVSTKASAGLGEFRDGDSVSDYAQAALKWAVAEKIISGRAQDDGRYIVPQGTATRAEVAAILTSFVESLK